MEGVHGAKVWSYYPIPVATSNRGHAFTTTDSSPLSRSLKSSWFSHQSNDQALAQSFRHLDIHRLPLPVHSLRPDSAWTAWPKYNCRLLGVSQMRVCERWGSSSAFSQAWQEEVWELEMNAVATPNVATYCSWPPRLRPDAAPATKLTSSVWGTSTSTLRGRCCCPPSERSVDATCVRAAANEPKLSSVSHRHP